jgi:hypothetical protein
VQEYNIGDVSPCVTNKDLGWSLVSGPAPPSQSNGTQQPPAQYSISAGDRAGTISPDVGSPTLSIKEAPGASRLKAPDTVVPEMMDETNAAIPTLQTGSAFNSGISSPVEFNMAGNDTRSSPISSPESDHRAHAAANAHPHGYIGHDNAVKLRMNVVDGPRPAGDGDRDMFVVLSQRPGGDEDAKDPNKGTALLKGKAAAPSQPLAPGSRLVRRTSPLQPTMMQLSSEHPMSRASSIIPARSGSQPATKVSTVYSSKPATNFGSHLLMRDMDKEQKDDDTSPEWDSKVDGTDSKLTENEPVDLPRSSPPAAGLLKVSRSSTQPKVHASTSTKFSVSAAKAATPGVSVRNTAAPPVQASVQPTVKNEREGNSRTGTRSRTRGGVGIDKAGTDKEDSLGSSFKMGDASRARVAGAVAAADAKPKSRLAIDPRKVRAEGKDEVGEELPIPMSTAAHVHAHARNVESEWENTAATRPLSGSGTRPASQGTAPSAIAAVTSMKWTNKRPVLNSSGAGPPPVMTMASLLPAGHSPRRTDPGHGPVALAPLSTLQPSNDSGSGSHLYSGSAPTYPNNPMPSPLIPVAPRTTTGALSFSIASQGGRARTLGAGIPSTQAPGPPRLALQGWGR